jgi:protein SCO1
LQERSPSASAESPILSIPSILARVRRRGLLAVIASLALLGAGGTGAIAAIASQPRFDGPRIVHPSVTPDFALHDQNGRLERLSAQRGKVVVMTFLYTHCPKLCPLTAVHIDEALDRLGPRRSAVTVLAVSVDPFGDTPAAVRKFVRSHRLGPQFHYLTGPKQALLRVWRQYDVNSIAVDGTKKPDHTLYVLLLDRRGKSRVLFDATATPAAMAHDLRLLLA